MISSVNPSPVLPSLVASIPEKEMEEWMDDPCSGDYDTVVCPLPGQTCHTGSNVTYCVDPCYSQESPHAELCDDTSQSCYASSVGNETVFECR